jgi:ADP-heptose:LPS heptosyltransferase
VKHVLVVRTDGLGDVLLTGPAVRAVANGGARVTMLSGPAGAPAAHRLPGVERVMVTRLPWIDARPEPDVRDALDALVHAIAAEGFDEAIVFTSFHQSALPTALVLRLAGIARVGAISTDYPGALLDVRHHLDDDVHEVERNLSLAGAMGYALGRDDDARLRLLPSRPLPTVNHTYVVVHPGASVPARTLSAAQWRAVVSGVAATGRNVVVTGTSAENDLLDHLTAGQSGPVAGLASDEFGTLVGIIEHADTVVVGNTGPMHLAAALGTPVVACFAPTVPAVRWRPWGVPHVLLGTQDVECAGCRASVCPRDEQVCLASVGADEVVAALESLAGTSSQAAYA